MIKKPKVALKNVLKLHKDTVIGLHSPGGPNGAMLYSCSKEGCVRILDLTEKKIFNTLLLSKGGPQPEEKSQDFDSESGEVQKISGEALEKGAKIEDLTAVVFTENTIYGGYETGEVFGWNLKSGEVIFEMHGHTKSVRQLIQLNVRIIASASSDNTIRCWDSTSGACENIIKLDGAINHMAVDGKLLYVLIGHSKIMEINTENYQVKSCLSLDDKIIVKILVKNNLFYLATTNNKIEVYEMKEETLEPKFVLQGPKDWIQCMKILDNHIYAGSDDKVVRVWNLDNQALVDEFSDHDDGVVCLEFCDKSLYTGSFDHTIRFWRLDEMFERIFNRKRMGKEDLQSRKFEAYCKVMFKGKKKGGKKGKVPPPTKSKRCICRSMKSHIDCYSDDCIPLWREILY